jgi:predicted nucleic acid-binding protein
MFYAAADRGDRSNERAKRVLSAGDRLVTSDHVLVETWILLAHRLGRDAAERWWEAIRSGAASVEPIIAADLEVAFAIGEAFPDQDFSIIDRTSFAVMQRLGVFSAASLDAHFAVFRFGPNRARAFELIR